MYMRSYFCEEEIFPNALSRVNKVSNYLSEWFLLIKKEQTVEHLQNTKKS